MKKKEMIKNWKKEEKNTNIAKEDPTWHNIFFIEHKIKIIILTIKECVILSFENKQVFY